MTKNKIAWAAGLFEGEGSITLLHPSRYHKPRPVLELQMTDFDIVRRFKKAVKVGCLCFRKRRLTKSGKRVAIWSTACKADVRKLLKLFLPYFGIRRRKRAKEVLKYTTYINKGWGHAVGR